MESSQLIFERTHAFEPEGERPTIALRRIERITIIGNHLPRRCGIATYTTDVAQAIASRYPSVAVDIWVMNDPGNVYDYPAQVTGTIAQDNQWSYFSAAKDITARDTDMVWIQHEFGIFGGKAGDHILKLIDRMTVPVAVTLHTVLAEPDPDERRVTTALLARCETIIVMAERARRILIDVYQADPEQIVVIPHGIPDQPLTQTAPMKAKLGFEGRDLILTFGLLSPGKGIETMIAAMPEIVKPRPNALYLVLGATHPHCIARGGESYREALLAQVDALGMGEHVRFINAFFETEDVLDYLAAADVYVTPYLNPAQVTSGTLAYAVGLGKPIVSTPYVHARELLRDGYGRLVEFGDSGGFAAAINLLLADQAGTLALRKRVYALGRTMIWPQLAETSMQRFEEIAVRQALKALPLHPLTIPVGVGGVAVDRMTDATGMLQHSVFGIADREHGYCIDDNARALMLPDVTPAQRHAYAGFVAHAWSADTARFRNFMGYDRRWREDAGSDDSNGRAVWALGLAAATSPDPDVRERARALYERVIEPLAELQSPRAQAFMILGTAAIVHNLTDSARTEALMGRWAERLMGLWWAYRKPGWEWFEPVLAYDNARLPEALIRAGLALNRDDFVERGLRVLAWLNDVQTTADGHFRAVGSDSFGRLYAPPLPFDQQPVEAWATVDACDAAFTATNDPVWQERARNAYRWFLGKNELGLALGDIVTGECFDGLMPTGVNRNRGAESILSFQLATASIQRHRGG